MDCSVPLAPDEADVGWSDNHSITSSASEDHFHLGQRPGSSSHPALSTSLPNSCSSVSSSSSRGAMAAMPASWMSQRPQPQPYQQQQHHQQHQHQQHQQYQLHQHQSQSQHQGQHIPHHRHSHSFHGYHGQHLFGGDHHHHHQSHHSHHHDHHHPPVLSRLHTSPLAPILHTGQLSPASTDDLMDMVIDETPPSSSAAPPMVHSASSSSCNTTNTGSWSAAEYGGGPVDADDDDDDNNVNDDDGDDDDDHAAAAADAAAAATASEVDMHWEPDSDDVLAVTKLEPLDDDFILDQLKALPMELSDPMAPQLGTAADLAATSTNATAGGGGGGLLAPVKVKRPRGRPRKHPLNTVVSSANKVAKGRSKTGCITCRRRKKKCDEAKPRCMNCEKNAVYCEGYHEKQIWKSGKERAEEERRRRESLPTITIQPLFHAVETTEDWIFWRHYFHHLSGVLTVEGEARNAFKDMVLMLANRDRGLMHSILAVSGRHIDLETPYGLKVLSENPTTTREALQRQADHHQEEAMAHLYRGMDRLLGRGDAEYSTTLSARYGQMICLLLQTRAEGNPRGEHRVHLRAYQKLIRQSPPEDPAFLTFITEFFRYHIYADELIWHPDMGEPRLAVVEESFRAEEEEGRDGQEGEGELEEEDDDDDDGNDDDNGQYHHRHHHPLLPPPALNSTKSSSIAMAATTPGHEKRQWKRQQRERKRQQRHPPRLLGVFDGLFDCLTQITTMRNSIRSNMARGVDPAIDYKCLWRAAEIDTAIREWRPRWPAGDSREKVGLLYQQVMWVYLFRTVYPPSPPSPSRSPSVEPAAAAAAAGAGSALAGVAHSAGDEDDGATPLVRPLSAGMAAALATPLHTPSAITPFSATARPAPSASSRRCSSSSSSSAPSSPASPSPLSPPYSSSSSAVVAPAQRPFPPATPISPAITCATTTTRPSTSSSVPPPPPSRSLADDIDDTIDDSSRPSSPPPFRRPAHHDRRVTNAVEESLGILESLKPSDPAQTLLLIPCLVIGTAAFDPAQRVRVAGAVRSVKGYTGLRSCDRVTELLDEVWRLMEEGDWVAVWDWQGVARRMELDFLCA